MLARYLMPSVASLPIRLSGVSKAKPRALGPRRSSTSPPFVVHT
jgi:hypothetical protein